MTRKQVASIILRRKHQPFTITTGLFKAPTFVSGSSGVFVVKTRRAKNIRVRTMKAQQTLRVIGEGFVSAEKFAGAEAHWCLIDKAQLSADSPLQGYDGFCFVGKASLSVGIEEGFVPYGETEVMLDADGRKFLIVRSEE